ncbi:polysaccharide polymerase [Lichenicola cladoniae]|uniref:polysaccharide polymerase n=1 Tax=Lichenicola cladoniae TaxID=1484109 RepID=UPI001953CF12|nr:polysaccharide polymerase [Lichenicola cladoniae]
MRASPARSSPRGKRLDIGSWLIIASMMFNMALCFIKTRGWAHIGSLPIIATELLIMLVGLLVIRKDVALWVKQLIVMSVVFMIGMKLINSEVNLKILHDLGIMYIFYKLGRMATPRQASYLAWTLMVIVLAVGFFELLFTPTFGQIFDVWSYYVDKGVIAPGTVNYSGTNLYLSGDRGALSRTFFPTLLGSHRVSSIFLEPDSLGNYAAIMFAWSITTSIGSRRSRGWMLALSLLCVVIADSRFAGGCCTAMLLVRLTPLVRSRIAVFVLPIAVMVLMTVVGSLNELTGVLPAIMSDNLSGRLLFSSRLLNYWHLPQWFAILPSQVYTADTGYAYVVNNMGLPLTLLFLGLFAYNRSLRREATTMKVMIAVYLSTSLCIGASIFTIKTAALLWFLYGVANCPATQAVKARARAMPSLQRFARPAIEGSLA